MSVVNASHREGFYYSVYNFQVELHFEIESDSDFDVAIMISLSTLGC